MAVDVHKAGNDALDVYKRQSKFRPEFLNRLDEIVYYKSLTKDTFGTDETLKEKAAEARTKFCTAMDDDLNLSLIHI